MKRVYEWTDEQTVCLSRNPEIWVEFEVGDPRDPSDEYLLDIFPEANIRNWFNSEWHEIWDKYQLPIQEEDYVTATGDDSQMKICGDVTKGNTQTGMVRWLTVCFKHPVYGWLEQTQSVVTYRRRSVHLNRDTDDWESSGGETNEKIDLSNFNNDNLSGWNPRSDNDTFIEPLPYHMRQNMPMLSEWREKWKEIAGFNF